MNNIKPIDNYDKLSTILDHWKDIRDEFLSIQHLAEKWPPKAFRGTVVDGPDGIVTNNNGLWDFLPLFIDGKFFVDDTMCPTTMLLIKNIPDIFLAGFSILQPGCKIFPHHGPLEPSVWKIHLGLICPDDAWIEVSGDRYYWKDGDAMMFDDTLEHFAQNSSDQPRIIFMVDILKDGNSILTH